MRTICLLLAAVCCVFAQLDDNTITVTASSSINIQPDQVLLYVSFSTPLNSSIDDALALVPGTGITAPNLASVYTTSGLSSSQPTQWSFTLPVSIAKLGSTIAALSNTHAPNLSYYVLATQVSPQLQAATPCVYPSLFADAQKQAQKVATTAGLSVGPVVAMSDASSQPVAIATLAIRTGDFSVVNPFFLSGPRPTCILTVQFKLLR